MIQEKEGGNCWSNVLELVKKDDITSGGIGVR